MAAELVGYNKNPEKDEMLKIPQPSMCVPPPALCFKNTTSPLTSLRLAEFLLCRSRVACVVSTTASPY